MNFDFPAILVAATAITGVIWGVDAWFFAPRRRRQMPEGIGSPVLKGGSPKEPLLVEYARSFFPVILIVLILRSFLVEPFRIPSGSMMPTLLVGDFILVNKFAYGIRLPVINQKIIEIGTPQRGDAIVFRYPEQPSIDYIKRVVGLPGDIIDYRAKTLFIDGQPAPQTLMGPYVGHNGGETGALRFEEKLGSRSHPILIHPRAPDFVPNCRLFHDGPVKIPEGYYLAFGDNRDNSNDSRCWGLVPDANLVGRAFAIWMSWDSSRQGFPVDFSRIGTGIH
ncbi:signal peptidase I [Gammaproteobacteria bacterium]